MKKKLVFIIVVILLILSGMNIYADENNIIEIENTNVLENELLPNNIVTNTIIDESKEINNTEETINNVDNTIIDVQTKEEQEIELYQEIETNFEQTKPNGIYRMAVGADTNKVVEIAGSNTGDNAKVDIWDNGNLPAQKFYFKYENGYYIITAMHTGKCLTVKDGNLKEGAEIVHSKYEGLDSQKWVLRDSNKNGWVISLLSNPQLSITVEGNIVNGSKLILDSTEDNDNQMFYLFNITASEQTKANGIYRMAVGADSNKVIEVAGSSTVDDAKVDIWDNGNVPAQKFFFKYENGYYIITAMHTGKSLTVKNGQLEAGAEIVHSKYEGLDSQKWVLRDSNKNGWVISLLSNPQLSITVEGNIVNGSKLILDNTEDNSNQMLYLFDITANEQTKANGTYEILSSADTNKSVEVTGSNTENNAKIGIWDYGNVPAQQFNIEYVEGYYKITAGHTGKSLTVKDGKIEEGTQIVQYEYTGSDSQKWVLRDSQKNGWVISPLSNLQLSITIDGNVENGSNLILSTVENNDNQMFLILGVVKGTNIISDGTYNLAIVADPNKSVEVAGSSTENNAKIDIWDYGNVRAQKFNIEYVENGYYKITAGHTDKSLTVKDNNIKLGEAIVQDEYRGEIGQMWIIRDSNINGLVISPVARPDMAVTVENVIENGSRLILEAMQNNERQRINFRKASLGIEIDSSKYPGITEAVDNLTSQHPNWEFEVLYTGIDFYTAVQGEYEYDNRKANLVDTSVYKGDWIAPNPYISGNWASASYNGIAYFLDPRNFLNDVDVFQFVDLSDYANSGATLESIQYQVNGTFLNNFAEDVRLSCEHQNVNPYYIIARLFQEQGRYGSDTIYMDGGDGKIYFNPFNIGAQVGNDVATALAKAKEQGWDSMQKGIEGGIKFIREGYLDAHQNTLYLNKFDVNPNSPGGFYTHQYMQNLSAAYSEARIFRGAYVDTGTLDNKIKFIIPVYENMPSSPAARPTGQGSSTEPGFPVISDQGPMSVQVYDIQTSLIIRSGPGTQYGELERLQNGVVLLSIVRYENGWQRVITPSGTVGYCSGDYLQFINDVSNCNERVAISTSTSVNVRIGPGQSYASLGTFRNGTAGTRILKDAYFSDGYTWDLVILDDGTKGFIASNYLRII